MNQEEMDQEFLDRYERASSQAKKAALRAVINLKLPKEFELTQDSFVHLGNALQKAANREREKYIATHGASARFLIGIAAREAEFAVQETLFYSRLMHRGRPVPDRDLAAASDTYEFESHAYLLFNQTQEVEEYEELMKFRKSTPFKQRLKASDLLTGAALLWLSRASALLSKGAIDGALDLIYEGLEAFKFANGLHMFDEGSENAVDKAQRTFALDGANARHAETRAMKVDVFAWLDLNMSSFKSMDAAAAAIAHVQEPITFRTARDWVGQWKKLRSAGSP